ncbi:MAG: LPS assembly lipoprotein LptE, partial [Geminicoccaceae bacterium]|nr:LPS assembly lipoprotein LptE [Geminicoccaceae bacterium]
MNRRALLLGGLGLLAGCGFRPMLQPGGGAEVREELAAVAVPRLGGRLGQLVRNAILEELNPTALDVPHRYELDIRLARRSNALGIQLDNTITRYNLTLTARFELQDPSAGAILYRSTVRRVASYNVRRAPYSTLVAEIDAERR